MLNPNEPIQRKAAERLTHTFVIYAEDKPGVLSRITSLFRRRAYNIDSLTAGHTDISGVSRLTVVMESNNAEARLIEANLYKLVNVLRVEDVTHQEAIERDLALIKVKAWGDDRAAILKIVESFNARVLETSQRMLILETTDYSEAIDKLIEALVPFGIIETVRTGCVAMTRQPEAATIHPHFVHARVPEPDIS